MDQQNTIFQNALTKFNEKKYDEAEIEFLKCDTDFRAYQYLAMISEGIKHDTKKALEYIDKSITCPNGDNSTNLLNKGIILKKLNKGPEAIEIFDVGLQYDPTNIKIYEELVKIIIDHLSAFRFTFNKRCIEYIEKYPTGTCLFDACINYAVLNAHTNYEESMKYFIKGLCVNAPDNIKEILQNINQDDIKFREAVVQYCLANKWYYMPLIILLSMQFNFDSTKKMMNRRKIIEENIDIIMKYYPSNIFPTTTVLLHNLKFSTNFYFAYTNCINTTIYQKICKLFRYLCNDLNYVSPYLDEIKNKHDKKIKIGFFSNFLHKYHSVCKDRSGIINNLSRDKYDIVYFTFDTPKEDAMIPKILKTTTKNIILSNSNIEEARKQIENEKLDILVYCELGMDPRSLFIAYSRLAPVQCNTWGHSDSSGIDTIDYYVSSKYYEKDGYNQENYSEKLIALDSLCTYYYNPLVPIGYTDMPINYQWYNKLWNPYKLNKMLKTRYNFGFSDKNTIYSCLQTTFKFNPEFHQVFKKILDNDPNALIILLNSDDLIPTVLKQLEELLGKDMNRIHVLQKQAIYNYFSLIQFSDVILDYYPFGGCNSSLDAFSLGTPVVTLPSNFISGRFSYGFYQKMGIMDLVASNFDNYVELAIKCANNKEWRNTLSKQILEKTSVLFNEQKSIDDWDEMLTNMYNGTIKNMIPTNVSDIEDINDQFDTQRKFIIKTMNKIIPKNKPIAVIWYEESCNKGDAMIWAGIEKMCNVLDINPVYICSDVDIDIELMRKKIGNDGIIILRGGGNFGDLYKYANMRIEIIQKCKNNMIIQLPQSAYFEEEINLKTTQEVIKEHSNIILMAREKQTYKLFMDNFNYSNVKIIICPDIAILLDNMKRITKPKTDILILARNDKEQKFKLNEFAGCNKLIKYNDINDVSFNLHIDEIDYDNINIHITDWNKWCFNSKEASDIYNKYSYKVRSIINTTIANIIMSYGKIVITDRLHAYLMCQLLGIPHIILDNTYGKLSSYYETWGAKSELTHYVTSMDEAMILAKQLLKQDKIDTMTIDESMHLLGENIKETLINNFKNNDDMIINSIEETIEQTNKKEIDEKSIELLKTEPGNEIPNIIHFIHLGITSFEYLHYLAIYSAYMQHNDYKIYLYYNKIPESYWWNKVQQYVTLEKIDIPDNIFGTKLIKFAHKADIIRLQKLIERGGIYLDIDVITLKNFAPLQKINKSCILGLQEEETELERLPNFVILAQKGSKFLKLWYEEYKTFDNKEWDVHSTHVPVYFAKKYPELIHIEHQKSFCPISLKEPKKLFSDSDIDFSESYCVHLWESLWFKNISSNNLFISKMYSKNACGLSKYLNNEKLIINIFRQNTDNVGDRYCAPYIYDNFKNYIVITSDIYKFDEIYGKIDLNEDVIFIIGGGGLLNCLNEWNNTLMNIFTKYPNNKIIIYGAGLNTISANPSINKNIMECIPTNALIGLRDYLQDSKYIFNPCVSCMHPCFEKKYITTQKYGFYLHHEQTTVKSDTELTLTDNTGFKIIGKLMKNDEKNIDNVLNFLGSSEIIITNTYHGVYWGMLLNKKVILLQITSTKFNNMKYKPVLYSGNFEKDLDKCIIYPNMLQECRTLNKEFYENTIEYINSKINYENVD